ncbi:MAG: glycosyltransferase family 2 protein [Pseudomonadota bacterium]
MPRVQIGLPVYNSGEVLQDSLDCLQAQTYRDFQVLMSDNASTDGTPDLCARMAAQDSRFVHMRRDKNVGALGNFHGVLRDADASLFAWRADDDLSAPDFLERLVAIFDARPGTVLAVTKVRTTQPGGKTGITPYPGRLAGVRVAQTLSQMFRGHASWIYGLWDRRAVTDAIDKVVEGYPHLWGWDHLVLLQFILAGQVAGTNNSYFEQRIMARHDLSAEQRAALPGLAEMTALRQDFARFTAATLKEQPFNGIERLILKAALPFYNDKRGYPRGKLWRRRMRLALGWRNEQP